VITSVYDCEDYLEDAVDSLLEQTMGDFELMLLDDGSSDRTTEIIERLSAQDDRVRGYRQTNVGQVGRFDLLAHQTMVETDAPFIAHLGADDIARPDRFERQLALFDEHPDLEICSSIAVAIDGSGKRGRIIFDTPTVATRWTMLRVQHVMNVVPHPTVMMRRRAFELAGPYSRGFACDYDFWTKAGGWMRSLRIDEPLIAYRVHERGSSTVGARAQRANAEGQWIRDNIRRECTLLDLYPELDKLGPTPERIARAGAHFAADLMMSAYQGSSRHALREMELAAKYLDDLALEFNVLGHPLKDIEPRLHELLEAGVTEARQILERIKGGPRRTVAPAYGARLFPELHALVPGPEDEVWSYNAPRRETLIAWCELDWADDAALRAVLDRWCRAFTVTTPARLVLAQGDASAEQALLAVQKAVADLGVTPDDAADIELTSDRSLAGHAAVHLDLTGPDPASTVERELRRLDRQLLWQWAAHATRPRRP
jgi:hypothetical protein